jgi:uncharacterized protein
MKDLPINNMTNLEPEHAWEIPEDLAYGPLHDPNGTTHIGRVGAPPRLEATSNTFHFWVPDKAVVEVSQIVTTQCVLGGQDTTFYALVDEVYRTSRRRDMGHEVDVHNGDLAHQPPFVAEGITYASASILRVDPAVFTPPREASLISLASGATAQKAYGIDKMGYPLQIGLLKNGGSATAGPGSIDLHYLLGENGGHLNVNGTAGLGTKSSFLLTLVYLLLAEAKHQHEIEPSGRNNLQIVPIIFNVKNYDLFHIDKPNSRFDPDKNLKDWQELGIESPGTFENVTYYAAQEPDGTTAVSDAGRPSTVLPYSWSLQDIITEGLFTFLFAEEDAQNENFSTLLMDLENLFTREIIENDGTITRRFAPAPRLSTQNSPAPTNFEDLLNWLRGDGETILATNSHSRATIAKLVRRLMGRLYECRGVLRLRDTSGNPLNIVRNTTSNPIVIDLNALAGVPAMQKFVIAAVLQQLVRARTGANAIRGLRYLIVLDELNRFAPNGGRDPITRLIETIAAEMRSQGILLFGAQQQASMVSRKVIENAATRVVGQTGGLELDNSTWSLLSSSAKRKAMMLEPSEKLILQSGFRQPMHLKIPYPTWAMNPNEAGFSASMSDDNEEDLPIGN